MKHTFVVEVTLDTGDTDPRELMGLVEVAVLDGRTWGRLRQPGLDPNQPCVDIVCVDAKETARRRAADSDGAAQAVCRGIETHVSHGGSIPWPTIRRPFEEWQAIHDREVAW